MKLRYEFGIIIYYTKRTPIKNFIGDKMKIFHEFLGKEVIDESGDLVGVVDEVKFDHEKNTIESIIIKEKETPPHLGLGRRIVPYDVIEAVGDKINIFLLKIVNKD